MLGLVYRWRDQGGLSQSLISSTKTCGLLVSDIKVFNYFVYFILCTQDKGPSHLLCSFSRRTASLFGLDRSLVVHRTSTRSLPSGA